MTRQTINRDERELTRIATAFRHAIIQHNPKVFPFDLFDFPNGCCGNTCLLLAHYLEQNAYTGFDYVRGKLGPKSHAWLMLGDIIIDITADQFENHNRPPVYVGPIDVFYADFREVTAHSACLSRYGPATRKRLMNAYRAIANWC